MKPKITIWSGWTIHPAQYEEISVYAHRKGGDMTNGLHPREQRRRRRHAATVERKPAAAGASPTGETLPTLNWQNASATHSDGRPPQLKSLRPSYGRPGAGKAGCIDLLNCMPGESGGHAGPTSPVHGSASGAKSAKPPARMFAGLHLAAYVGTP